MWNETTNLKFFLLNAENLFLLFDGSPPPNWEGLDEGKWQALSTSVYDNKPLHKCKALARTIQEQNPDILMLCEVGGHESLQNFNEMFLDKSYSPVLIEGNSDRNIDVGFLVRKNLGFYFDLLSNRNRPIHFWYSNEKDQTPKKNTNKFSRDVAELRLFKNDREKPFLVILHTHLKSRLDKENMDPGGVERRRAELKTLIEIYSEVEKLHPEAPILVSGDFNGNASRIATDEEFQDIYLKTPWQDVLEVSGIPPGERATFYQVRNNSKTDGRQIDYCFLTPRSIPYLAKEHSQVIRYKDEFGLEIGIPTTLEDKDHLPADHYPIIFELSNLKII